MRFNSNQHPYNWLNKSPSLSTVIVWLLPQRSLASHRMVYYHYPSNQSHGKPSKMRNIGSFLARSSTSWTRAINFALSVRLLVSMKQWRQISHLENAQMKWDLSQFFPSTFLKPRFAKITKANLDVSKVRQGSLKLLFTSCKLFIYLPAFQLCYGP